MEFRPLGKETSPFCRMKWLHIRIKITFFHLSVWLIGQGEWKFFPRRWFDSCQFAAKAEKLCWGGNCKILLNCQFSLFWRFGKSHAVSNRQNLDLQHCDFCFPCFELSHGPYVVKQKEYSFVKICEMSQSHRLQEAENGGLKEKET